MHEQARGLVEDDEVIVAVEQSDGLGHGAGELLRRGSERQDGRANSCYSARRMEDGSLARDRTARARTRSGRLASLDRYLVAREGSLLVDPAHGMSPVVDVGFGDSPITTLQLAEAVRASAPGLQVIGYEIDPGRAAHAAARNADALTVFRHGGFQQVAQASPKARVIRVMNVLRSYPSEAVTPIRHLLGAGLVEGGLLIEGTSDTEGHVLTAWLLRRRGESIHAEGLLLFTDFERGFNPWLFRDYLPRDLRRSIPPGTALHEWLSAWERHWAQARAAGVRAAAELFRRSLFAFCQACSNVDGCRDLGNGYALWTASA